VSLCTAAELKAFSSWVNKKSTRGMQKKKKKRKKKREGLGIRDRD
jgi:hypothetical protein